MYRREAVRTALGLRNPYERLVLVRFSTELSDLWSGSLWRMSRFLGAKGHRAVSYSFELPDQSEVK